MGGETFWLRIATYVARFLCYSFPWVPCSHPRLTHSATHAAKKTKSKKSSPQKLFLLFFVSLCLKKINGEVLRYAGGTKRKKKIYVFSSLRLSYLLRLSVEAPPEACLTQTCEVHSRFFQKNQRGRSEQILFFSFLSTRVFRDGLTAHRYISLRPLSR